MTTKALFLGSLLLLSATAACASADDPSGGSGNEPAAFDPNVVRADIRKAVEGTWQVTNDRLGDTTPFMTIRVAYAPQSGVRPACGTLGIQCMTTYEIPVEGMLLSDEAKLQGSANNRSFNLTRADGAVLSAGSSGREDGKWYGSWRTGTSERKVVLTRVR